jgi:tetratricopeptide (TPR) repeat protein
MTHDVFISYSSFNKDIAEALCLAVEKKGLSCWIAPRDIPPGAEYAASIVEGIDKGIMLILILSKDSNNSQHVLSELNRAFDRKIPIIPVRVEDIKPCDAMSYFLSTSQWFDAITRPITPHLQRLAEVVEARIKGQTVNSQPLPTPPGDFMDETEYQDAMYQVKIGNYQQAITFFDACLSSDPHSSKAWIGKGGCYLKQAEKARQNYGEKNVDVTYEKALTCFNNAIKNDTYSTTALIGKAECLIWLESYRNTNFFTEIKDTYNKAVSIDPKLFDAYNGMGYLYLREYNSGRQAKQGILKEAVRDFDEALKLKQDSVECWYGKAEALEMMFKHTQDRNVVVQAIECLDTALRIDPSYSEAKSMKDALSESLQRMSGTTPKQLPNQFDVSQQQPRQPFIQQDVLSGRWIFTNGVFWDFAKQGYEYFVVEYNPMIGRVAEGRAVFNGNNIMLSMNAYNGNHLEAVLVVNGNVLQGTFNMFGMQQPLIAYRVM